ncbi:hypothetical protein ECANGB1_2670 [Enterospora canceri]|uniref:Uncharacterized protein n=1 Tax=Enterospora canceri TaxID=1081671 RepID=A0A1Y1S4W3_9MICR|nr:hypothetical protein ECANGB1_2670 [Enterospora canceri]
MLQKAWPMLLRLLLAHAFSTNLEDDDYFRQQLEEEDDLLVQHLRLKGYNVTPPSHQMPPSQ